MAWIGDLRTDECEIELILAPQLSILTWNSDEKWRDVHVTNKSSFSILFHGKICIRKTLRLQTLCHHVASRTHYYRLLSLLAVVVQHRKPHWIIMITTSPWTERPNTHKWSNLCTRNHSHFIFFIRCCLCRLYRQVAMRAPNVLCVLRISHIHIRFLLLPELKLRSTR